MAKKELWENPVVMADNLWDKISNYDKMTEGQRSDVIAFCVNGTTSITSWRLNWYIRELILNNIVSSNHKVMLFKAYLETGSYGNDDTTTFNSAIAADRDAIVDVIRSKKDCLSTRRLLTMDYTLSDEIIGLRALSKSKHAPLYIFDAKYQPTLDALKELPSIMRLKALEALVSNTNLAYNPFELITNEDEFKKLMFSSVTKYRDRVEAVWEKYNELMLSGQPSTIELRFVCTNCSDYSIFINNKVIRTKTKFEESRIGRTFENSSCMMCGRWGQLVEKYLYINGNLTSKYIREDE